jgi:hypothetical protein
MNADLMTNNVMGECLKDNVTKMKTYVLSHQEDHPELGQPLVPAVRPRETVSPANKSFEVLQTKSSAAKINPRILKTYSAERI